MTFHYGNCCWKPSECNENSQNQTGLVEVAFFSVIIPTFNRLPLLKEALNSVWRQTYADYEVIVVDDGSSDGTANYLKSLDERVKVLTQLNCGPGAARNSRPSGGLRRIRGVS